MRFISFTHNGKAGWGRDEGDHVIDLSSHAPDLKSAIAAGQLSAALSGPQLARSEIRLLPVIPNPAKILCVGHNYEAHRVETGRVATSFPSIFTRFADTLIGADDPIVLPKASSNLDYEAELAVVIGKGGRNIALADAMSHVAGLSCFNDASIRDWQWHSQQFTPGKNFPGTGAFGPALVTLDEIDDLDAVRVQSILNGAVMQSATLDHMLFSIPVIINYISQFTPLSPGDVIATGTPGGVGAKRTPPVWMKAGDEIVVEVSGIGRIASRIVAEA
ncbi:MAG: fumarylacetoacetate hydrolase family protein [Cypionkella sp.]|nr:fumarylacetoacetate hydrolase family protein [Cypionkella sp.]